MAYYEYRPSYSSRQQEPRSSRARDKPSRSSRYGHSYNDSYPDPIPTLPPRRTDVRSSYGSLKRRTWPPPPIVEDEKDSLAREYGPSRALTDEDAEVRMRGTIDQEPLLEDVLPPPARNVTNKNPGRNDRGKVSHNPSIDARVNEWNGNEGRRLSLNTKLDDPLPSLDRRAPSPYSFTKPSAANADYFLSPDAVHPNFPSIPRYFPTKEDAPPNKPPRPYASNAKDPAINLGADSILEDSDVEHEFSPTMQETRRSTRYSFTPTDSQKANLKTSLHETPNKLPDDVGRADNATKTPFSSPGEHSASDSSHSTRPSTPSSQTRTIYTQPVSARTQNVQSQTFEGNSVRPKSIPSSPNLQDRHTPPPFFPSKHDDQGTRSRPGSRQGSRKASPLPAYSTQMPTSPHANIPYPQGFEYAYPLPYRQDYNTLSTPIERLDPWIGPPRIDVNSPSPARAPGPVPYPTDDMSGRAYMPSETSYQYQYPQDVYGSQRYSSARPSPSGTPTTPARQYFDDTPTWTRPGMPSYRSASDGIPKIRPDPKRHPSTDFGSTSMEITRLSTPKALPACTQPEPTHNFEDWYALIGESSFMVCPSCYVSIVAASSFTKCFRPATRRMKTVKVQCHFSLPWIRTAWLLIQKRKYENLDLLWELIPLNLNEPCSGHGDSSGCWFGVPDENGDLIPNFNICYGDKKRIEALFPRLKTMFLMIPKSSIYFKDVICSLQTKSKRFDTYLERLEIAEKYAYISNRDPDMRQFIEKAREFANLAECTRDELLVDELWYFIPSMPDFTVCEECFDDVVVPAWKDGMDLARQFHLAKARVPPAAASSSGHSCQLFSPRMRRVWARAVRDTDWNYLHSKVMERKEKELGRQIKRRQLKLALRNGEMSAESVKKQLDDEELKWKQYE